MWTQINILDTDRKEIKELRRELPDLKDVFSLKELKVKDTNLYVDWHDKKDEKYYPIIAGKNNLYATIKLLVTTKDNKHFCRELQIRVDDTHHNDSNLHINLNLRDRYIEINKKEEIKLGEFHTKDIRPQPHGIHYVGMSMPGKCIILPVICFIDNADLNYHKEQEKFFNKLKAGKLTKEDEVNFKKIFDTYSKALQKRKGITEQD